MKRHSVRFRDRHRLPPSPGVYWVYARDRLLYVGTSKSLQERHTDNFGNGPHHLEQTFKHLGATDIAFQVIHNEARRLHTEAVEMRKYDCPLNRKMEPLNQWLLFWDNLKQVAATVAIGLFVWWVLI